MKFTRLKLSGFKSFVDPTELFIEPGLTGVVGPNGCGKSNLVEALRWVMGENRPTSMRGSGMEDVIFGGSTSRPMRNNAEVMLFIDNSDRGAPAPYNEVESVEISRRIERELGSDYRINGRDVRQRDVQIFFADASTGSTSPALVRQGQISVLINQKPLARRAILEEAAGVAGLHQRRHEAELRLKAAETNMARLDDIIAEVDTQLQGLKRQARQASRYKNLSGYIRKAEALVFLLRWKSLEENSKTASAALESALALVAERTARAAEASTAQANAAALLPPLREKEAAKGAALQRLIHEREALDAEESRAREEAQRLRQRIGQAEQDILREKKLEQDATNNAALLDEESGQLDAAGNAGAAALRIAEEKGLELSQVLSGQETLFEQLAAEAAELNAKRAANKRVYEESQGQIARLTQAIEDLQPQLASAEQEKAQSPDIARAEESAEDARDQAAQALQAMEAAATRHAEAAAAAAHAKAPLDETDREVQRLSAETLALASVLRPNKSDLWPPVMDSVRVHPGFETALAAALGDDLIAPMNEAAPRRWQDLGLTNIPPLPLGAEPLSKFVEAPPALARRLAFTGLIDRAAGAAAQRKLLPGQRLVTAAGDLWRWDGFSASADAVSPAALQLEQRNRLAILEHEFAAAKAKHSELFTAYSATRATAETAENGQREAERALRASEGRLIQCQEETTRAARAVAERFSRLASLEAEHRRLEEALASARAAEADSQAALAALSDGGELSHRIVELRGVLAEARSAAADAAAHIESLKRETASRSQRLETISTESERWAQRLTEATAHTRDLAARVAEMQTDLAKAEAIPATIETRRGALLDAISLAESERKSAADRRAEGETHQAEFDRVAKAADSALSTAREERAAAEARSEAALGRANELAARVRDELDAAPEDLAEHAGIKPDAELPPLEQAEARVEKLKAEREQMGGVNLRAEDEAAEHEKRLQTFQNDRADLDGAIQRLRKGIQSLNKEGRERLVASFEKVNANFERLFKELFQGGEARLTFTESDDPLEAGLEILARPPGKKLTTLSLLSGGEQALTAIALIFAVFLVNPAPICVLDEVDAPLDDANVERFCALLDEMTRLSDTRFLIITHHALTMSRMDRLFGVTMAERGVSQLVSVSLAEAEQVAAAE